MLTVRSPHAERMALAMESLNMRAIKSLYQILLRTRTLDLARWLAIHTTPKHGSWVKIVKIELTVTASAGTRVRRT